MAETVEPHEITDEELKELLKERGLAGLANLGNTCYMNSTLQALFNLPVLSAYLFKKSKYIKYIMKNIENSLKKINPNISQKEILIKTNSSLTNIYFKTLVATWEKVCTVEPRSFKAKISHLMPIFRGNSQNDSPELINLILDTMHEEMKHRVNLSFDMTEVDELEDLRNNKNITLKSNASAEDKLKIKNNYDEYIKTHFRQYLILKSYDYWEKFVTKDYSIIRSLMTGLYYSKITCHECNYVSNSFEPFTILTINITQEQNIYASFTEFCKEELLTGDNKYDCSICKKKVDAIKQLYVWYAPPVLIVHFKRFHSKGGQHGQSKDERLLKFPITDLSISNLQSQYKDLDATYDLQSTVHHYGQISSGHYISINKNSINNKWYVYNDNTVSLVSLQPEQALVTSSAYIAFYIINEF